MTPRVAVVYHFFPHYRSAIVRELARSNKFSWAFYSDTEDFDSDIKPMEFPPSVRFHRLPVHRLYKSIMWQSGVVRLAASRDCDVLILLGVSKYLSMWPAAVIGRLTGKRVLFWTHGWTYRPRGPLRYVRRWFYKLADALMVYGRWSKQIAIEEGFDPLRVHVIGNCLDLTAQQSALSEMSKMRPGEVRIALFGESATPVVACTSRLTRVRRLDMLLDALVILRDRGRKANVIIIGDGPERANLEKQAARLGISVAFIGSCYDETRIGELLRSSNVTVAPGKVGLTAMHSMAFGIPVVTHGNHEEQMPEFEAVIPGKTGALFQEGDLSSLADAIEPWIQEQWPSSQTSIDCQTIVDRFWSPKFQCAAILRAVEGHPADDLFYIRLKQEQTDAGPTS